MSQDDSSLPIARFIQEVDVASKERQPADRKQIARLVVLLFTAVRTCHEAYLRYSNEQSDENEEAWRTSVETLGSAAKALDITLHILAPDVYSSVTTYVGLERLGVPREARSEGVKFLDKFVWSGDPSEGDFQVVISRLGEFIRDNFTMEEIFEFGH